MLALYHMVRGGIRVDHIPSLKPIMERVGLQTLPKANVAVLVGTALDPTRKKNPANLPKYTVNTIWGEMAYQLVTSAGSLTSMLLWVILTGVVSLPALRR